MTSRVTSASRGESSVQRSAARSRKSLTNGLECRWTARAQPMATAAANPPVSETACSRLSLPSQYPATSPRQPSRSASSAIRRSRKSAAMTMGMTTSTRAFPAGMTVWQRTAAMTPATQLSPSTPAGVRAPRIRELSITAGQPVPSPASSMRQACTRCFLSSTSSLT